LETIYPEDAGDMQIVSGLAYYYKQIGDVEKSALYEKTSKHYNTLR